ncbi:MAG: CDP-alcohol phosphatidyltransferase family protein [Burkholderiales bacterium]|nr:CDP-alcohol phosphatidyltransferase family protein [Burkholderiales bacterium]
MQVATRVPLALTVLRALLGPVVLLQACAGPAPGLFGACLIAAFLSDVFDGIVARRLGIATAGLRRLDSLADTVFYVAATAAVWRLHPEVIRHHAGALLVLLALELARYAFDLRKFGREAAYHMVSSKAWGIALFAGFYSVLVFGQDGVAVGLAIGLGIVADLEGLAISAVLPSWRADVPSIVHALRIRAAG